MFLNDNKPGFCQTELVLSHYKSLCNPHGDHVASKIAEIQGKSTKKQQKTIKINKKTK